MNATASTVATPEPVSEQNRLGSIALDQWRGLALVLVLVSHGFYFTDRVSGLGRVGVNLFFFISGILVFRSLARSRASTAWERTRSYWWRRLRRLYPALVAYVLVMLPLAWLLQHRPNLPPDSDFISYLKTMPLALTATINYSGNASWSLGHLWSVACEMQFYLIAPLIFIAGGAAQRQRNLVFGILLAILVGLGATQPVAGSGKYHFEFADDAGFLLRASARPAPADSGLAGDADFLVWHRNRRAGSAADVFWPENETGGGGDGRAAARAMSGGLFVRPAGARSSRKLAEMAGRTDLLDLFVAGAVHHLQLPAKSFAAGWRAGFGRRRRRVVPPF
jgi:hypothetical protein